MNNKIIATLMAATIFMGIIPAQAEIKDKEVVTTISTTDKVKSSKLTDGKYTIYTKAKNASKPEEDSTADKYLEKESDLYVENGEITLKLKFKEADLIKEIGVKINDTNIDDYEMQRDDSNNITLEFNIDSLDDSIKLPMKINPFGNFTVSAEAIIQLDKEQLKDEDGNIVDLDKIPDEPNKPGTDNGGNDGDSGNNGGNDDNNSSGFGQLEEGVIYTIENKALNETSSSESLAGQFLDKTSNLEVSNGRLYITLKFTSGNMMSNQKVTINGTETNYETIVNDSKGNFHMKFPIKSVNDDIKISMFVSAVGSTFTFRLKLYEDTVKDPDGNSVDIGSDNGSDEEDAPEIDLSVDKKYKAENIVTGHDGNSTPIIANYIEKYTIVQVEDKSLYAYITFVNSNIMTYRELTINGEKSNFYSTVNSNGTYTIKVKINSINDTMEFTNLLTKSISDAFTIKVNGNTLQEYIEENNTPSTDDDDDEDEDLENGTYTIKNKILKENSDSESVARDYVDTESGIEVKNDKIYLTLKFTKGSLMSNVSVKVEDKKTSYTVVKDSGDKYHIKFKIGSLSDEILVSSKINVMSGMDVKFRVLLRSSTLDEVDSDDEEEEEDEVENDGSLSGDDNEEADNIINGSDGDNNITGDNGNNIPNNTQSYTRTTYSIKNKIVTDSDIGYKAARDAIDELSYLQYENDKIYLTLNLKNTDLMSKIKVIISGNEVKYNTFDKNPTENTMSIKFEVPNENPNMTIKAYIEMIGREISFGLNLLPDTKTFIKTEEIKSSQLEDISGGSDNSSNDSSSSGSGSSGSQSGSSNSGGGTSGGSSSPAAQQSLVDSIKADQYFKRYTISNTVISNSDMGRSMSRKYLNEMSILEEIDGKFYVTLTFTGASMMDNFRFTVNGADVEYTIVLEDAASDSKSLRFPITSVNESIQAYMFIKPVGMNIDFGIKLLEDTMVLVEEGIVDDGLVNGNSLDEENSFLGRIVDKTTKDDTTGEISPVKIAVSTSVLTILLNQLLTIILSLIKKRSSNKLLGKVIEE